MPRLNLLFAACLTLGALTAQAASAQEPRPVLPGSNLDSLAQTIDREERIRLIMATRRLVVVHPRLVRDGITYSRTSSDGLVGRAPNPVPLSSIREIQVRRSQARRGALIGGLIGVGAGFAAGTESNKGGPDEGREVFAFIGLFGGLGAGAGAVVGALTRGWRSIYIGTADREEAEEKTRMRPAVRP